MVWSFMPDQGSMSFSHEALDSLRKNHPAWRLLRADSAPLVASTQSIL